MPRVPDASDMIRKKKLEIEIAGNKYADPLKFRVALPSISFYNRFAIKSVLPNFLLPTKVLPNPTPTPTPTPDFVVDFLNPSSPITSVDASGVTISYITYTVVSPTQTITIQYKNLPNPNSFPAVYSDTFSFQADLSTLSINNTPLIIGYVSAIPKESIYQDSGAPINNDVIVTLNTNSPYVGTIYLGIYYF